MWTFLAIVPFNVNLINKKTPQTMNTIPRTQGVRRMIAVSTRVESEFAHYTLAILTPDQNLYFFDPQGNNNDPIMRDTRETLKKHAPGPIIDIYSLNPACYRTRGHQTLSSQFCSVWVSCLAFLLNANPTRTIKEVFDYFGYKAPSPIYLDQKIKLFTSYLFEMSQR